MTGDDYVNDENSNANYEVGYKKPPRDTQFRKGQSGNPKGRPKGTRNFKTDVQAILKKPIRLNKNGRTESVSTQEGMLLRMIDSALKGDARALSQALALAATHNNDEFVNDTAALSNPINESILKNYFERHYADGHVDEHLIECAENDLEKTDEPPNNARKDDGRIDRS